FIRLKALEDADPFNPSAGFFYLPDDRLCSLAPRRIYLHNCILCYYHGTTRTATQVSNRGSVVHGVNVEHLHPRIASRTCTRPVHVASGYRHGWPSTELCSIVTRACNSSSGRP